MADAPLGTGAAGAGDRPVLVAHDAPEDFRAKLQARFPAVDFRFACSPAEIDRCLAELDPRVAFSIKHPGFPAAAHRALVHHPSVRWVQVGGSGIEHLQPWDATRVTVTNCVGVLAPFLAETVTGAILALNGGFPRYLAQQRERCWRAHPFTPLSGQTLLLVGLGRIGALVAANARMLGMRVVGLRRSAGEHPAAHEVHPPEALGALVGGADVVSLHVRLDEGTRHLFDRGMLAAMKPGALLVNTSRGPVVDESALAEALTTGHLGGAYLDVFENEPLAPESPLWDLPNVILTPHASDNVHGWPAMFAEVFADNLARWLAGLPLLNTVQA